MTEERLDGPDWWYSISEDPNMAFSQPYIDDEKTKPLADVIKLREIAAKIHTWQLWVFSEEDRLAGSKTKVIPKDQLLQLSSGTINDLGLEDFIPVEETAELCVSARSRNLFIRVSSGDRKITFSINQSVNLITTRLEHRNGDGWQADKEKLLGDFKDFETILNLFENSSV